MIFITPCTKIKSFTVSSLVLLTSLLILNFGFTTDALKIQTREGDSVKTLKRIYSSVSHISFSKFKTADRNQQDESSVGNSYIAMKNSFSKGSSDISKDDFQASNKMRNRK